MVVMQLHEVLRLLHYLVTFIKFIVSTLAQYSINMSISEMIYEHGMTFYVINISTMKSYLSAVN